jgi:hypothetical protein
MCRVVLPINRFRSHPPFQHVYESLSIGRPTRPLCTSIASDLTETGGLMGYGELVIALFVVAVLFIAFTYEDPRDSRN